MYTAPLSALPEFASSENYLSKISTVPFSSLPDFASGENRLSDDRYCPTRSVA